MRHLVGIVLAVGAALAIFFGGGWGYLRLLRAPAANGSLASLPAGGGSLLHNHHVLFSLAALLAVGLLIGLLMAVPWISPLATGLPGLALLALTGLYLGSVRHAVDLIPLRTRAYGLGFEGMLFDGVLALAGLAMVVPLFVPSRWRRRVAIPEDGAVYSSGLLSGEDTAVTQQGDFFPPQDTYPTQAGTIIENDPFPSQNDPFPPQQNPFPRP